MEIKKKGSAPEQAQTELEIKISNNNRHTEVSTIEELHQAIKDGYGYFMQDEDGRTMYAYDGDFAEVNPNYEDYESEQNAKFMGCPINEAEQFFFTK